MAISEAKYRQLGISHRLEGNDLKINGRKRKRSQ